MDIASIAAAFVGAQAAQLQTAAAAKMLRMNADASADVAKLLAAAQNLVALPMSRAASAAISTSPVWLRPRSAAGRAGASPLAHSAGPARYASSQPFDRRSAWLACRNLAIAEILKHPGAVVGMVGDV
jgi:hypothetical protein